MTRWGMVIDVKKCISCYACVIACKQEHFLPPGVFWRRLLVTETGEYPHSRKWTYPILCNHCRNAPCVQVCPTGASSRRSDGIVTIDPDKCIGCQFCATACPYQRRSLIDQGEKEYFPGQGLTESEIIGKTLYPHRVGTITKCNFCKERIDGGMDRGLKPGVGREATPACVLTCPVKALTFGDLDDPESKVAKLIWARKGYRFLIESAKERSVFYID